jgi:hypothetical protein
MEIGRNLVVISTEASPDASGRAEWRNPLDPPKQKGEGIPRLQPRCYGASARDDNKKIIKKLPMIKVGSFEF